MCGLHTKHPANTIALYKTQPSFCIFFFLIACSVNQSSKLWNIFFSPDSTTSLVCSEVTKSVRMLNNYVLSTILQGTSVRSALISQTHRVSQTTLKLASRCLSGNSQELVSISAAIFTSSLKLFQFLI